MPKPKYDKPKELLFVHDTPECLVRIWSTGEFTAEERERNLIRAAQEYASKIIDKL